MSGKSIFSCIWPGAAKPARNFGNYTDKDDMYTGNPGSVAFHAEEKWAVPADGNSLSFKRTISKRGAPNLQLECVYDRL
jgi:hypothetical protein